MKTQSTQHWVCRLFVVAIFVLIATLDSGRAFARSKRSSRRLVSDSVESSSSAPGEAGGTWQRRWGLGFSTPSKITAGYTAITGWYDLCPHIFVQPYFTVPTTSPFQLAVGGLAKYTVIENSSGTAGFHVGAGPTFGDVANGFGGHSFAFSLAAVGGFHAQFPGAPNIMLQLDGGPVYTLIGGDSNFSTNALSPALGFSAIYIF